MALNTSFYRMFAFVSHIYLQLKLILLHIIVLSNILHILGNVLLIRIYFCSTRFLINNSHINLISVGDFLYL